MKSFRNYLAALAAIVTILVPLGMSKANGPTKGRPAMSKPAAAPRSCLPMKPAAPHVMCQPTPKTQPAKNGGWKDGAVVNSPSHKNLGGLSGAGGPSGGRQVVPTHTAVANSALPLPGAGVGGKRRGTIDLSGTWVGNRGSEVVSTGNGTAAAWGGPANPTLRGTAQSSGGPDMNGLYHGTWKNQQGNYRGWGTSTCKIINPDLAFVTVQGWVTDGNITVPYHDSGYVHRK
jgi:hypothetical protein